MARLLLLLVVTLLTGPLAAARADDKSHRAAAEELLKVVDAEKNMQASIDVLLEAQLKANPQLAPAKEVMKKFFAKHFSYASLKDEMVKIYTSEFTEEELKAAAAFYSTPAGKKIATKLPALLQKGAEIGAKRVQEHADELRRDVEEALKDPK